MKLYNHIPVIDISIIRTAKTQKELMTLADEFREVYTNIGFAYITNHGISPYLVEAIFEQSRLFHQLPEEEKLKIKQNKFYRGYMPLAASTLTVSTLGEAIKPNQSAAFILGYEVSDNDPDYKLGINIAGPNQWPEESVLPEFKKVLIQYREELSVLVRNLIRVFALALGQDYYALDKYFIDPTHILRLQHYPKQPIIIPEQQYGIAPHTDYGVLTILAQDNLGGLQVKQHDESWLDVPPLEDAFVLNTGDMIRRLSNDLLLSTPHRVINISGKERYSIPFFFEPNMQAIISPLTQDNVLPKYEPIKYGPYLMQRVKNNYSLMEIKEFA